MARIFLVLVIFAVALLAANFVIGLAGDDFHAALRQRLKAGDEFKEASKPIHSLAPGTDHENASRAFARADEAYRASQRWMTLHTLLGSAAALVTVHVNSIAITYFIGTSRWCKEVCEMYALPLEVAERSTILKRRTFPWALSGIVAIIGVVGLGAAADPTGANFARSASFVMWHYMVATLGLVIVAIAFCVEISRIAENSAVIEEILAQVRRIRAERNLPLEEVAAP